jgi:nucleotide-binding universal stress UspA family protein
MTGMSDTETHPDDTGKKTIDSALVPIGFNEPAKRFQSMIPALRVLGLERVVLLHLGSFRKRVEHEDRLSRYAVLFREEGLATEVRVGSGSPALQIHTIAVQEGLDCIVFCWKMKTRLQRAVTGSVTLDVIRMSSLPVFVYKRSLSSIVSSQTVVSDTPAEEEPVKETKVMYATDFGSADAAIIPYLNRDNFPVDRLIILHAGHRAPDPAAERERIRRVKNNLNRLSLQCGIPDTETLPVMGTPGKAVARHARRLGADVIILGKTASSRGLSSMLGSVAEAVAFRAWCSVLIVPPSAGGEVPS